MKKILLVFSFFLCLSVSLAQQARMNTQGNMGIGAQPNAKARLLIQNSSATASDSLIGLYATVKNTNSSLTKPLIGIYSQNTNTSAQNPLYGMYMNKVQD
ncbi:MAG: hypothetical protein LBU90_08245 [Bacteroidales bacterium]|jgi:hypothetical protein|nr:hypothetical protein [Bacteroidales bacterium]